MQHSGFVNTFFNSYIFVFKDDFAGIVTFAILDRYANVICAIGIPASSGLIRQMLVYQHKSHKKTPRPHPTLIKSVFQTLVRNMHTRNLM